MVKVKGLEPYRPKEELAKQIASKPYDVLNSEEARQAAQDNPYSFLHVVKSEIDLQKNISPYDEKVYQKAADNLQKMKDEGWLYKDKPETFYIYRQIMDGHEQYGIVVAASVDDYVDGKIKKNEKTREKKEKDRINHVKTTNAHTGPVFLTYNGQDKINNLVAEIAQSKPDYDFVAEDGIQHTVWSTSEAESVKIKDYFDEVPHTYIADGHHRSKAAYEVRKMRKEENPDHTGEEEYNYFLSVLFPHQQLEILDYNRVVQDLNGLSKDDFLDKIEKNFEIEPVPDKKTAKPKERNHMGMYIDGEWYSLRVKKGSFDDNDPVKRLDVQILMDNLLSPVLEIGSPRTDDRIDFVGGIRGLEELEKRVDSGEAVAFAMYPTSIEEVMDIADAGKLMPPKSTWFEPKLRSGLFVHDID